MWWPAIGGYYVMGSFLFNNVSFFSFFVILAPSLNNFAELSATLVSEFGSNFKRV